MTGTRRITIFLFIIFYLFILSASLIAADIPKELEEGITAYQNGRYENALRSFRSILTDSSLEEYQDDAYFWIGKTYTAHGNYEEAARHLEYFLANFPNSSVRSEGLYQKGRLLYLQGEYEPAIKILYDFVQAYPNDLYIANAYFWIGESLYSIGHLNEAEEVFRYIEDNYPASYKIEAARFRMQLIQFKHRENELVKLLKISHEEYLKAVEEFVQREKAYEQALMEYQKRLAVVLSEDLQNELERLNARVKEQELIISQLKEHSESSSDTSLESDVSRISPTDTDAIRELLDMKAEALELKEYYLGLIERSGQ